jgi:hypothetical protein
MRRKTNPDLKYILSFQMLQKYLLPLQVSLFTNVYLYYYSPPVLFVF